MPFVEPRNRDRIKLLGCEACESVGDLCYVFYAHIMQVWRDEPRWRTAHRLYRDLAEQPEVNDYFQYVYSRVMTKFDLQDVVCAAKLAYKVFWDKHVLPYEKIQEDKNGSIV